MSEKMHWARRTFRWLSRTLINFGFGTLIIGVVIAASGFAPDEWVANWIKNLPNWFPAQLVRLVPIGVGVVLIFLSSVHIVRQRQKALAPNSNLRLECGDHGVLRQEEYEDYNLITTLRIGLRNMGSETIDGLTVLFVNAGPRGRYPDTEIHRRLVSHDQRVSEETIHVGDIKYYKICRIEQILVGMDEIPRVSLGDFERESGQFFSVIPGEEYRLKLRITARTVPAITAYFLLYQDDNYHFHLRPTDKDGEDIENSEV